MDATTRRSLGPHGPDVETTTYPYPDGDVLVLGPEIFANTNGPTDATVINWRGMNFVPQPEPEQDIDAGRDTSRTSAVDGPAHYGGADNPYEVIKVIEATPNLQDFHLGNCYKYVARAGVKSDFLEDLGKALWYLDRKVKLLRRG